MKKILSVVISFALLLLACPIISVASNDGVLTRRALVMSAVYDYTAVCPSSVTCMYNAFYYNGISTSTYVQSTGDQTSDFLNAITSSLSSADDDDISYVFINSHGDTSGNLYINGANSSNYLSLSTLKSTLDTIDGHIILMISSCYAGNAINRNNEDTNENQDNLSLEEQYINYFLYGSAYPPKSGEFLNNTKYAVLCSSLKTQQSWSFNSCTAAAQIWATGLGYIVTNNLNGSGYYYTSTYRPADWFSNSLVTLQELTDYSNQQISILYPSFNQTFCSYAASPYYTIVTDDYLLGDINQSDSLTMTDVLLAVQHVNNINPLSGRSLELADIDGDGFVDNIDVNKLRVLVTMG